jgi:acyl dehydratase
MPVPSDSVGACTAPFTHHVDARWLMAYAAGLRDHNLAYLDTERLGGVVGHPLFPVCVEWPVVLAVRGLPLLAEHVSHAEARRGVHATHDLLINRPVRAGDVLTTSAEVVGVERRKPGAFLTMVLTTVDATGAEVCRTTQGSLYLGVDVVGDDRPAPPPSDLPPAADKTSPAAEAPSATRTVAIGRGDAHTYTECAHIWNPIHTDVAVAHDAGLADIILHGTATLAHAVTFAVEEWADGDPTRVRRVRGRFGAMVLMPSTITVRALGAGRFEVRTDDGAPAIEHGHIELS